MYEDGSRSLKYRLDILNGQIKIGELEAESASITFDGTSEDVKSSFKCVVRSGNIDYHKHRIRPVLIDRGTEYFLGTYLPGDVSDETDGGETLKSVEAYDLSILAKNDAIIERVTYKAGTLYLTAIQGLLISCGITNSVSDPTDAVFTTDRSDWDIGTSKITIINQLLSEISFNSLYIDNNGYARLSRYQQPSIGNIKHTYKQGDASIIEPGTTVESNMLEIPNIFIATVSNPDLPGPLVAKYVNDNPLSKTSTVYTGQNKVKMLSFDNVATQADLQNAVNKAAFEAMQGIETSKFKTAVEAGHGLNDVCQIDIPEYNGIVTETGWEIDLVNTSMTHTGRRLINL